MYKGFENLRVWQEAHKLVLKIYELSGGFPKDERFGLTSQLRRAAVSVPSNIVEGKSRPTAKDYLHFLHISRGSLEEVKYQLILSKDLGYIDDGEHLEATTIADNVGRMLSGLMKSLQV